MKIQGKHAPTLSGLMRQLSRDPRLKQVIAKARRQSRSRRRTQLENLTDLYLLVLEIAARFSRKKKARALEEQMDIVSFLVQMSLLVKENVFDRPEVKQFFNRSSKHIYQGARKCIAMILPEKTRPQQTRGRRAATPLSRARRPSPAS